MTLKKTVSIFSRQFKRAFNENKYQNYTDRQGHNTSHLAYFSFQDLIAGRFILNFGISCFFVMLWTNPDWFHETIRHYNAPPSYDNIDKNIKGQERALNKKIIHREQEEHKLESFMEKFRSYSS